MDISKVEFSASSLSLKIAGGSRGNELNIVSPVASMVVVMAMATATPANGRHIGWVVEPLIPAFCVWNVQLTFTKVDLLHGPGA